MNTINVHLKVSVLTFSDIDVSMEGKKRPDGLDDWKLVFLIPFLGTSNVIEILHISDNTGSPSCVIQLSLRETRFLRLIHSSP